MNHDGETEHVRKMFMIAIIYGLLIATQQYMEKFDKTTQMTNLIASRI